MAEVEGIEKRWALFGTVPDIVNEKFNKTMGDGGYADTALRQAQETISRLEEVSGTLNNLDVDITIPDLIPPVVDAFVATPPVAPSINLNMPDDLTEADEVNTAIRDKLLHDITQGGPAIPLAVEIAIFERESERAELLLNEELDKIRTEWSKSGFTLPDGMLAANLTQAIIEHNNKRKDVARELAIKSFELSDANTKFAIEKGLQYYIQRVEVYKAKVQAEVSRIDAIVKKFLGEVEVYKGTAQVYTSLIETKIKVFDSQIKAAVAKADLVIKDAEIDIENFKTMNGLKIEAMKAIGSINAQVVAGALSSVSAGVSLQASNGSNYTYNTNPSY